MTGFKRYVLGVCALLLVGTASIALAAEVELVSETFSRDDMVAAASSGSNNALQHIQNARAAIGKSDVATAERELTSAQTELQALRKHNPSAALQDAIQSTRTKLKSEGAAAALALYQPVAESVVVADDYEDAQAKITEVKTAKAPFVTTNRGHQLVMRALDDLKKGDTQKADVDLQSAYESVTYTDVDLPIAATYWEVTHALQALQDIGKGADKAGLQKVADGQLAAAESSARTLVASVQTSGDGMGVSTAP